MRLKLKVSPSEAARLEACCQTGYICETEDGCEFDNEVTFKNGVRMAIQVCRACYESCWTQGVLFDADGNELGFTPGGDTFLGEYVVEYDDVEYVVDVCV